MEQLEALILGIVQGLTEFLPISSSGHLVIVPWLFDFHQFAGNEGLKKSFDVAVHIGTLAAALSGIFAIWFVLALVRRHSYGIFVWYRLALAATIAMLILTGIRSATL